MKIYVRRRHIQAGVRRTISKCPIALAVKDATGVHAYVDGWGISAGDNRFALPRAALRFVLRFDSGKPVKPFAFVLK